MSSIFKIDRPEIFKGTGIYWGRPASERDDELREFEDIYVNRNRLAEDFEIIKIINQHDIVTNVSKHTQHQEVYKCKKGYLVAISMYTDRPIPKGWVDAVDDGFTPYGLLYNTRCCLSMIRFVEDKKELKRLLTVE